MSRAPMGSSRGADTPRELELRFWWLVLLAKLIVLVLASGLILAVFTEYRLAGAAITLIGIAIAVRWAYLFRKSRQALETDDLGADRA